MANMINVLDNTDDRNILMTVEFTKNTLLKKLMIDVFPKLKDISAIMYPIGTPADLIHQLKAVFAVKPEIIVEESKLLGDYEKQVRTVNPDDLTFWINKGYEPADQDELKALAELYNAGLKIRDEICDILGITNVSKDFVYYLRTAGQKSNDV